MKLTHGAIAPRPLPNRHDPDYDDPRPLEWDELMNPMLWLAAVLMLVGLVAFIWLVAAVVPA